MSLPGRLGAQRTRRLLAGLAAITTAAAFAARATASSPAAPAWGLLLFATPLACAALLAAVWRGRRSERFYEWWVEGLLFLPALAVVLAGATSPLG